MPLSKQYPRPSLADTTCINHHQVQQKQQHEHLQQSQDLTRSNTNATASDLLDFHNDIRNSTESYYFNSHILSHPHSLKASTSSSEVDLFSNSAGSLTRTFLSLKTTNLTSLQSCGSDNDDHGIQRQQYDSGFDTAETPHSANSDSKPTGSGCFYDEDSEDSLHEKNCLQDAKHLLTTCLLSSSILNKFKLVQLLGYGTFGIVIEAIENLTGRTVAIKIMRKSQIHQNRVYPDPETGVWSSLEVVLLKYSPFNENIIRFIDSWDDTECLYLVTELGGHAWNYEPLDPVSRLPQAIALSLGLTTLSSSSLLSFCLPSDSLTVCLSNNVTQTVLIPFSPNDRSSAGLLRACGAFNSRVPRYDGKPIVPEAIQKKIFKQLVSAVLTLHENGICHKDIKDENVLIDRNLNLRLIDFGHSAVYRTQTGDQIKSFKTYGTPVFSPPETRSGIEFHGPSADVYAIGLMLYEYNYGDVPDSFDEALYIENGECIFDFSSRSGFASEECMDLCRWMLQPDPRNRPTIEDVADHPFLS